jgi:hypothetical protein
MTVIGLMSLATVHPCLHSLLTVVSWIARARAAVPGAMMREGAMPHHGADTYGR